MHRETRLIEGNDLQIGEHIGKSMEFLFLSLRTKLFLFYGTAL